MVFLQVVVYSLKPRFRSLLRPVGRWACRFHPNTISLSSVAFAVMGGLGLLLAPGAAWLYLVVPLFFFLRIAANALDGMVAQWTKRTSRRGEFVNESTDRLNDVIILGGLFASGVVDLRLAVAVMAVVLLVSYLGVVPRAAGGPRLYSGPLGKADRMLLLGIGCIAAYVLPLTGSIDVRQVFDWTLVVFLLLGVLTVFRRTRSAWQELRGETPGMRGEEGS